MFNVCNAASSYFAICQKAFFHWQAKQPTFPNLKGTKEPLYGYSCWLNQLFIFYDLMPFANALKCIFLRKKREFSRLLL